MELSKQYNALAKTFSRNHDLAKNGNNALVSR
jgi:hypothetical protein